MKFTLESLKVVESSLIKLLKEDLPIRVSYQLSKLYDIIVKEMQKVEEMRQELVKRYGEEVDNTIKVTPDNALVFSREYSELMNELVDGGTFEAISVKTILDYSERLELMAKSPISLSALDISQLKSVGILIEGV